MEAGVHKIPVKLMDVTLVHKTDSKGVTNKSKIALAPVKLMDVTLVQKTD